MAQNILHVEKVLFFNGEVLENKTAFLTDNFLIIEDGEGANWYNLKGIEELQGVTIKGRV